ncbi:hypothetical protein HDV01_005494 [Terramyces sp. JEL0728]|nr:hypothetical protein HDV01_005494 [Terramyces sp. JEL0728]
MHAADLLLINNITTTEKVLLALTKPIPIISSHWLKALSIMEYPEYELYAPMCVGYENVDFNPNQSRKTVFKGKTFYLKTAELYKSCKNIITSAGGNAILNKKQSNHDDGEYLVVDDGDTEPYVLVINDISAAIMSINSNFTLRNIPEVRLEMTFRNTTVTTNSPVEPTRTSILDSVMNYTVSPLDSTSDHEGILSKTRSFLSEQLESNALDTPGESIIQKALTQMPETDTNFDDFMDDLFDLGTGPNNDQNGNGEPGAPSSANDVTVKQERDYTQTQMEIDETRHSTVGQTRFSNSINETVEESTVKFENFVDETNLDISSNQTSLAYEQVSQTIIKQETQYDDQLPLQIDLNYTSQLDAGDLPLISQFEQPPDLVEYILPSKRPQSQQIQLPIGEESQLDADPKIIVELTDLVKTKYLPKTDFKRFKSKQKQIIVPLKVALITSTAAKGFHFDG